MSTPEHTAPIALSLTRAQLEMLLSLAGNAADDIHDGGAVSGYMSLLNPDWDPDVQEASEDPGLMMGEDTDATRDAVADTEEALATLIAILQGAAR